MINAPGQMDLLEDLRMEKLIVPSYEYDVMDVRVGEEEEMHHEKI